MKRGQLEAVRAITTSPILPLSKEPLLAETVHATLAIPLSDNVLEVVLGEGTPNSPTTSALNH